MNKRPMSVREHNERMFKLSEKNRETPAFNVRQYSNPFMLASTQSLLTQLVAKGGVAAVPTTSASMGTVSEPFVETSTNKAEAEPSAGESTFAEEAAKVFLSSEEKAEAADEARHVAHQAYKENKKEYAKESAIVKATLPAGWSLKNSPEQLAAKLAESTAAYSESQVYGTNKLIDQMEEKQMGTGNTRARKAPAMYAMLKHRLSMAEAHLKVMKQHNRDQVKAYKKTYATENAKRDEGARLHKIYQDAHRMSRDDYAASYKAQQAASNIGVAEAATAKIKAGMDAAKAKTKAAAASKSSTAKTEASTAAPAKTTTAPASSADAKAAAATAKAIPDSADFKVTQGNMKAQKDFVGKLNEYKSRMSELAKAQKPSTAGESKAQLERDSAGLMAIRKDLATAQDNYNSHMNTDFKPDEAGAYTKEGLAQYNALSESDKEKVRPTIQKYTKLRGDLIQFDTQSGESKKLPPIDLTGKTYTQRRAELKKAAEAHSAYLTWYAAHQKLYQELFKARNAARESLKKQVASIPEGSPELTKADSKAKASAGGT